MMKLTERKFINLMSTGEKLAGIGYLPIHIFGLPIFFVLYVISTGDKLPCILLTAMYYGIGLIVIIISQWRFLRKSFDVLLDRKREALGTAAAAFGFEFVMRIFAALAVIYLAGDAQNPNESAMAALSEQNFKALFSLSVVIGPIVEETLFRGLIFGWLRTKNRVAAYIVSSGVFVLYNIWQHYITDFDPLTLVFAIQYIPAGIALAWGYERTGCIWVPILTHSAINTVALVSLL